MSGISGEADRNMARSRIQIKNADDLAKMRESGRLVANAFEMLNGEVRAGVSTLQLDDLVETFIRDHGAMPSFKGYRGFPRSICTAVNDEVVHGIPSGRRLEDGDIIAIDIGAILDGWHGDATRTFAVGEIDAESQRLMDVCAESLDLGIVQARAGNRLTDISAAIEARVERDGFKVVHDLYGHGVGRELHEAPMLPHYGPAGDGPKLKAGMVITIEPMIVAGERDVLLLEDRWTIITRDGSRSAQYEHTVAITDGDPWILTLP
jgi:methionyl aminopeptidase